MNKLEREMWDYIKKHQDPDQWDPFFEYFKKNKSEFKDYKEQTDKHWHPIKSFIARIATHF